MNAVYPERKKMEVRGRYDVTLYLYAPRTGFGGYKGDRGKKSGQMKQEGGAKKSASAMNRRKKKRRG